MVSCGITLKNQSDMGLKSQEDSVIGVLVCMKV